MKRIRDKLKENKGGALVFGVCMLFFVAMLTAVSMTYAETKATAAYIQNTAQSVLDTYTVSQGRAAAESFKNGCDYTVDLNKYIYIDRLRVALGIGRDNTGKTNGRVRFILPNITLDYTVQDEIDSTASMKVQIPVYFFKTQVTEVDGTVTVRSKYAVK